MEEDEPMGGGESEPEQRKSGTPRLYIKELVMRNFKSYAGEQRVGPFHKSFSAVVGPNGSGKSNVIDAMLFVFGKRAKQVLDLLLCFLLVTELCLSNSYVYLVLDAAEQSFRANSQLN
jgi:hypothetical protein